MHNLCHALSAFLAFTTLVGVTRADLTPRLKASWKEKNARVEVFSPDGRSLVSSGDDGHRLRDSVTGRVRSVLTDGPGQVHGAVFSPDGRLLLAKVGTNRHDPVWVYDLKVWGVATGKEFATFPYVSGELNVSTDDFALSYDGKTLAFLDNSERLPMQVKTWTMIIDGRHEITTASNANPGLGRIKLWDVAGRKVTATLDGGSPLVFSPDDKTLITGTRDWHDPTAKIWEVKTGRLLSAFDSGGPWVKPLVFSPDGKYLAIGNTKSQTLHELAGGRKWTVAAQGWSGDGPVFSPSGSLLFPNGLTRMRSGFEQSDEHPCYDLTTLPPNRLELGAGEVVISPDGRRYAAVLGKRGSGDPLTLAMHELPSRRETGRFEVKGLDEAEFSPDGRWLALLAGRNEILQPGSEARWVWEIRLVDPATLQVWITIPSPGVTWGNHGWKFSPDGKLLSVYYRPGSTVSGLGAPDLTDRPMNLDIWELPSR